MEETIVGLMGVSGAGIMKLHGTVVIKVRMSWWSWLTFGLLRWFALKKLRAIVRSYGTVGIRYMVL